MTEQERIEMYTNLVYPYYLMIMLPVMMMKIKNFLNKEVINE